MEIKVEIGANLLKAIERVVDNANVGGVSAGDELRTAFNIDITQIAVHLGTHKQAIDKGLDITVESKSLS